MQSAYHSRRRNPQQMRSIFLRCSAILGPCLWLILPLLAEAGSVSRVYGSAVGAVSGCFKPSFTNLGESTAYQTAGYTILGAFTLSSSAVGYSPQLRAGAPFMVSFNFSTLAEISATDLSATIGAPYSNSSAATIDSSGDFFHISSAGGANIQALKLTGSTLIYTMTTAGATLGAQPAATIDGENGNLYTLVQCSVGSANCDATQALNWQFIEINKSNGIMNLAPTYRQGPLRAELLCNPCYMYAQDGNIYFGGQHTGAAVQLRLYRYTIATDSLASIDLGTLPTFNPAVTALFRLDGNDGVGYVAVEANAGSYNGAQASRSYLRVDTFSESSVFLYPAADFNGTALEYATFINTLDGCLISLRNTGSANLIQAEPGPDFAASLKNSTCISLFGVGASCAPATAFRRGVTWTRDLREFAISSANGRIKKIGLGQ